MEMMKERFAKLLLGEDMSGSGKGVCTALAISNAITNLCGQNSSPLLGAELSKFLNDASIFRSAATIFGQLWRLEPLPPEKKAMWRREMDWLLCISDHIVELVPTWQSFPDGTRLEVQTRHPLHPPFHPNIPANSTESSNIQRLSCVFFGFHLSVRIRYGICKFNLCLGNSNGLSNFLPVR
jgi:hypothetical protein